jgi:ATP-dependent DNA ligase
MRGAGESPCRLILRSQVRAFTRNGNDWTRAYKRVVDACGKLVCETALIDGEMVVQDELGLTDFNALRSAIYTAPHRLVFFAFDLLNLNNEDALQAALRSTIVAPQRDHRRSWPQNSRLILKTEHEML